MTQDGDLFSFGTLMDTELLEIVCGQSLDTIIREPAHIKDYIALWVQNDHYPVLVPREGATTQGVIIRGLTDEALDRIIFFEGGEFSLQNVEVQNARNVRESVIFFADNALKSVSDTPWHLEQWQRATKPDTMPRVTRYMQCYGVMSVDEADAYW